MCAGATGLTGSLGIPIVFDYTGKLQVHIQCLHSTHVVAGVASLTGCGQCGQVSHKTSMIDPWHVQTFVAPLTTTYNITAVGAGGGNSGNIAGGTGANVTTSVTLKAGTTLDVVAGGMGFEGGGGGGASFVFAPNASNALIVAGTNLYALWLSMRACIR